MGVQLRVLGAAGVVAKAGDGQITRLLAPDMVIFSNACCCRMALCIGGEDAGELTRRIGGRQNDRKVVER